MKDLNERFVEELAKMKDPVEVLGLAKILSVKAIEYEVDDEGKPTNPKAREATNIIIDMIDAYAACGRARKREILKLMRATH